MLDMEVTHLEKTQDQDPVGGLIATATSVADLFEMLLEDGKFPGKRRAGSRPAAGTKLLHRWWNWQTRLTQNQANSDVHAGSRPAWCTTNRGDDEHTDPAGSIRSLAGAAPPLCAMLAELEDAAGLSPAAARHPSSRLGHRTSRIFRDVAKQVRHRAHNAAIVGSNPTITTTMPL